uniref:Phorbol-ester/DAG-type domain-containing protein n=1 Tax=Timema cristinae TaxID=61476 RepID=A0A7R9CWE3_TIMCR|nr:unnamed protein product [Timema cristinae]
MPYSCTPDATSRQLSYQRTEFSTRSSRVGHQRVCRLLLCSQNTEKGTVSSTHNKKPTSPEHHRISGPPLSYTPYHPLSGTSWDNVLFVYHMSLLRLQGETYSFRESLRLQEYKIEDVHTRRTLRSDARWSYQFYLVRKSERTAYTLYARTEDNKRKWMKAIHDAMDNLEPSVCRNTTHTFKMNTFEQATTCHHCSKFLKGIILQGYLCGECSIAVHKQCIEFSGRCHRSGAPPEPPPRPPRLDPPPNLWPDPSLKDHLW